MSIIRRLKPVSETQLWWSRIQRTVEDYQVIMKQVPTLNTENPVAVVDRVKMLYVDIQHSQCPDAADEIYTYITRAMINLTMSYESMRRIKWDDADVYYERALQDWFNASRCLAREGIVLEA